ncbi:MAG: protease inhibitor I42 family protein [Ferruginibacter sp.]
MEKRILKINESFELPLKGRAMAGYEWQYRLQPANIVLVKHNKLPSQNSSLPMPGSSADEIFTITALEKGITILHFYLVRTWESRSIEPKEEKKIEIKVI